MRTKFSTVGVGGTFDELHKGHRTLLKKAFEISERVIIGLTSDNFITGSGKPHKTAPYEERLQELTRFLEENGWLERSGIIPIDDPSGGVLSPESPIEALVVSRETEPTARKLNEERRAIGLPPLQIVVIDMVPSENHGLISTTRIRHGEIDKEGRVLS